MNFKAIIKEKPNDYPHKTLGIVAKDFFQDTLNKFNLGQEVYLTIDDRKPKRSEAQNDLYWLYLTYIGSETGNHKDDLHFDFSEDLNYGRFNKRGRWMPKSTKIMRKGEFREYMLRIQMLTGYKIPDTQAYLLGSKEEREKTQQLLEKEYPEVEDNEVKF